MGVAGAAGGHRRAAVVRTLRLAESPARRALTVEFRREGEPEPRSGGRSCESPLVEVGGELTAGALDLAAAGIAYGDRHALQLQPADELVLVLTPGGGPP
jgi:hypothetical protein